MNAETKIAENLRNGLRSVAHAVTPLGTLGTDDASGGHVESLTEAVMGMTSAMCQIASALHEIAEAIEDRPSINAEIREIARAIDDPPRSRL